MIRDTYVAYGKAVAVGSGAGCRKAAAWSWAAAAALYIPLAARAVALPRVKATPRNAAADTGDITTSKTMFIQAHCYSYRDDRMWELRGNSHFKNAFLK